MKISVLMPIFATPIAWAKQAIESIIYQDHPNFNFIIVDDNNPKGELTDYLYNLSQRDCCINIVRTTENQGIAAALDFGLTHCSGDLIVRMDADDIAYKNLLSVHDRFFTMFPDRHICGIQIKLFDGAHVWHSHHPSVVTRQYAANCMGTWFVNHPGIAYRKTAVLEVGGYGNIPHTLAEDYALWVKLLNAGYCIYNHDRTYMDYRVHEKSFSFAPNRSSAAWHEFLLQQKQSLDEPGNRKLDYRR